MFDLKFARRLVVCAALALAVLVPAGASYGSAETGTFPIGDGVPATDPIDLSFTCLGPGAVGTITVVESGSGHFTENGPPAFGFHARGSSTQNYRMDFVDGRYVIGVSQFRFSFNATGDALIGDAFEGQDHSALYDSSGDLLGPVTVHDNGHVVYEDLNHDNEPDAGDMIKVTLDNFWVRCG